jgi:hypothetical protein
MKLTTPLPDTEHSLFYSAINALRIAGQEKLADDLDQRMEDLLTNEAAPKMRLGKVKIKFEHVVDLDSEYMIKEAKYALCHDLMNALYPLHQCKHSKIHEIIEVTEQDNNLEPSDIPIFLTEEAYVDDVT